MNSAEDVHHENPSFVCLANEIRGKVTDHEIENCLGEWDWFAKENFQLPDDHRITSLFDNKHSMATLKSLCKPCHNLTKKKTI